MTTEYSLRVRLTPQLKTRLDKYCEATGLAYSEVIRTYIATLPTDDHTTKEKVYEVTKSHKD